MVQEIVVAQQYPRAGPEFCVLRRNFSGLPALSPDTVGLENGAGPWGKLSMQIPNRPKQRLGSDMASPPDGTLPNHFQYDGGAEPPASFEDWLDGRLKALYQAVVNEPLPPEILELLGRANEPK